MSDSQQAVHRALQQYIRADSGDDCRQALETLLARIKSADDVRVVVEMARASHRALIEEVERRKELIESIEGRPNAILPVVGGVDPNSFIVSQGRGHYVLAGAMQDADTGAPIITAEELVARGPCMGALSPDGSTIVQVLWPDEHRELALLIFGQDIGVIDSVDDDYDDGAGLVPLGVPVHVGEDD